MDIKCFIYSFWFVKYPIVSEMLSNPDYGQSNVCSKLFLNYESLRTHHKKKKKKCHQIWEQSN